MQEQEQAEAKSEQFAKELQDKLEQDEKDSAEEKERQDEAMARELEAADKQSIRQHKQELADLWSELTVVRQLQRDGVLLLVTLPHLTDVKVTLAGSNTLKISAKACRTKYQYAKSTKQVEITEKVEILTKEEGLNRKDFQAVRSQDVSFEYESVSFGLKVNVALRRR